MTKKRMVGQGLSAQLPLGLWLLMGPAIAVLAIKPALAETLTPLPDSDPESIESTSAVALTVEPEAETEELIVELAQNQPVQITDIQIEAAEDGFSLRLEASGELTAPETSVTGNAAIADIPNAVLQLPGGDAFFVSDPVEGISLIDVSPLPNNQVRIAITGTDAPPTVTISVGAAGLVVSGAPGDSAAQAPDDGTIQITVTGDNEDDYFVPNASTATRTDTPVLDIPASIQVIPEQVLDDQQAVRIEDALTNVSGVAFGGSRGGFDTDFTIRGFDGVPILRDGFRQFGVFGESAPEIANLERIEVLRGPASILYGAIEPGGLINLVTKQPLAEPFYEVQFQLGNRSFLSPQIDFSGPLTEDGRLRYRLNALYRNEAPFEDFERNIERFFVAPTLSWQISDRTDLTLQLEYSDYEGPSSVGLFARGTEIADVPFNLITGEPSDFIETETVNVGYNLEHRFNENWRLRNAFRFNQQDYLSISAAPFLLNGPLLFRALGNRDSFDQNFGVQTNVVGEFSTGAIDHTLLFGVDFNRTELTDFLRVDLANLRAINIFAPVYGTFDSVNVGALPIANDQDIKTNRFGIYLQDQIDILDNLILVAGVRYDTVNQTLINRPNVFVPTATQTVRNDSAWTPRVGIVYQPISNVSLYGSYSQSFVPNSGTTANGEPFEPERGEGFEAGVKAELLGGSLLVTLAYFDIAKQNVVTTDPNNPFFSVATGEQRSRGVELDITGEILPGWNVIASYAYIDAQVTDDNRIPEGNRLFNAPEHSASLWTTYEIQDGDLAGLGFGLGFNFVGERVGDLANSFNVNSYFLTNAAIFYERDRWRAAINMRNLFDVDYIAANRNGRFFFNEPGAPFTIIGSFSVQF